jgi:acyl carrier protein
MTTEQLIEVTKRWVTEQLGARGYATVTLSDGTDLLKDGVLDSLAFVDLLMYLQVQVGRQVDLADADPERFTTIAGLCHLVLSGQEVMEP